MLVMGNALEEEDDQKGTHLPVTALAEAMQKAKAGVGLRGRSVEGNDEHTCANSSAAFVLIKSVNIGINKHHCTALSQFPSQHMLFRTFLIRESEYLMHLSEHKYFFIFLLQCFCGHLILRL